MTRKTKEQICQEHSHVDKYGAADTLVCEAMQTYADQEILSLQDENKRLREYIHSALWKLDEGDYITTRDILQAGLNPKGDDMYRCGFCGTNTDNTELEKFGMCERCADDMG